MARRKSSRRFLRNKHSRRNLRKNKSKKRGGNADLLTPLLLLGAQQLYARRRHRKGKKTRKTRRRR